MQLVLDVALEVGKFFDSTLSKYSTRNITQFHQTWPFVFYENLLIYISSDTCMSSHLGKCFEVGITHYTVGYILRMAMKDKSLMID
jgi:hypothetical protein